MKMTTFCWTYTKIYINAFKILFLPTTLFHYCVLITRLNRHTCEVLVENAYLFFFKFNSWELALTYSVVSPLWLKVKFKETKVKLFLDINLSTDNFLFSRKTDSWSLDMWEYIYIPANFLEKRNSFKIFPKPSIKILNSFSFQSK